MELIKVLEVICVITAVLSIYIYGNGSWYAPLLGLFSQIFWVAWACLGGFYTMLFLSAAMVVTHLRNFYKMNTKQKLKEMLYSRK